MWRRVRAWCPSTALFVPGALIAAAVLAGGGVAEANHNFTDVPTSAFYHDFVDFLVQSGITSGCGSGLFCPNNAVTRAQMAVFLEKLAIALGNCPPDSVEVGPTCIDKYEASVWEVPPASVGLIQRIRAGTVTLAELQAGAVQRGTTFDDWGEICTEPSDGCPNLYAVSIAGVKPSRFITWPLAAAAAANAGKRLPTNAEWQAAALGTPAGSCWLSGSGPGGGPVAAGSMPGCISDVGAVDMVGNVWEWVADWVPQIGACSSWDGFSTDMQCLTGDTPNTTILGAEALIRGAGYDGHKPAGTAGVFALFAHWVGSFLPEFGFRAAR